jgi:hypothetical protein
VAQDGQPKGSGVGRSRPANTRRGWSSPTTDFNGQIKWIQIDLGDDAQNADHLVTAEDRLQIKVALR